MDAFKLDDDGDDSDDSDYEYQGGDSHLYDSRLDDTDEIKFLKDNLIMIS